ncbi:MAG: metallophosphoesterase, partial [Kiritimatiellia bacterium]|nr:metallophosphoesterase [Kiritimatiellia bacterium]
MRIAVLSDIHVLGPLESERSRRISQDLGAEGSLWARAWQHGMHRARRRLWNRRAPDRERSFHRALDEIGPFHPDWIVANGDYSGDAHGVGLSDPRTFQSVSHVVELLRRSFPDRCLFIFGDHELGK